MEINLTPTINFFTIYNEFIKLKPDVKISYLNFNEISKIQNFPIKEKHC